VEVAEGVPQAAADLRDGGRFFRGQIVEILVGGIAGVDLVLHAVEASHQHGGEGEVGVGDRVGEACLDTLALGGYNVGNADGGRVSEHHRGFKARDQALVGVGAGVGKGVQGLGVLDDAADVVQGGLGQARVAVAGELVDAAFPEGLVHVHAGTVVADDGLGHEGGGLAVGVGHVVDAVLEDLDFVRLLHQGVELDTDFALASVGHFVVVYLDVEAHLLHGATHGGAQVVEGVDRRDGEVATLDPGAVAQVAVDELLAGGPGGFLGGNLHEGAGHVGTEVYFVKDEE